MGQASVLTETEIRRVFRIIATTRHAERNRVAFVLSIYAGLRIGEIAALTVSDVATANGDVRSEIKLGAHQTKGSKGRTVILSRRVRKEIGFFLKNSSKRDQNAPLIASQRNNRPFTNVTRRCCLGKSTRQQASERPHIRAGGRLRRGSMRKGSA
jgi:integrase/recombinase XerD